MLRQMAVACVAAWMCLVVMGVAWAQAPAGAAAAPPELQKHDAEWALQAQSVARQLALSPEQTTKLVDAYKAGRESHQKLIAERFSGGPGGYRGNFEAMREATKAERAKLETALKGFLNEEQTAKALASLGTFNRRWDSMTTALADMKLEEAKMNQAMQLVTNYVVEFGALMQSAGAGGEGMRDKARQSREKLDVELAKVLTAEQLAQWKERTAMRGRDRRGGPGAGPAPK